MVSLYIENCSGAFPTNTEAAKNFFFPIWGEIDFVLLGKKTHWKEWEWGVVGWLSGWLAEWLAAAWLMGVRSIFLSGPMTLPQFPSHFFSRLIDSHEKYIECNKYFRL